MNLNEDIATSAWLPTWPGPWSKPSRATAPRSVGGQAASAFVLQTDTSPPTSTATWSTLLSTPWCGGGDRRSPGYADPAEADAEHCLPALSKGRPGRGQLVELVGTALAWREAGRAGLEKAAGHSLPT